MADEDLSPLPFRRERNLSNRNFNKRNSRRRISQQAAEQERHSSTLVSSQPESDDAARRDSVASSSSSSLHISYSVNSVTESAFNRRSLLKMREATENGGEVEATSPTTEGPMSPQTPDPAWLDVRQKVHRFETLKTNICFLKQERHSLKLLENRRHPSFEDFSGDHGTPPATPPRRRLLGLGSSRSSSIPSIPANTSIDEVRSEDEVDQISDFETDPHAVEGGEYVLDGTSEVLPPSEAIEEAKTQQQQQQVHRSISADQSKGELPSPLKMRNDFPR